MCTLSTGQLTEKKHTSRHRDAKPRAWPSELERCAPCAPTKTCRPGALRSDTGTQSDFGEKQLEVFFCLFCLFVLFLNNNERNHNNAIKA